MTHTPGPWKVQTQAQGDSCFWETVRDANNNFICGFDWHKKNEYGKASTAEQIVKAKANARLIAAAPDLLAALQGYERMSDIFTSISNPSRDEVEKLQTALKFIAPMTRAAIVKAKGKS